MRLRFARLLSTLFVVLLCIGCDGCGADMSTREGVAKAYERATGVALDEHACVERPEGFAGVVMIGGFAYDRGCEIDGFFVDGTWVTGPHVGESLLARAGWPSADGPTRARLARKFLDEIQLRWGSGFVVAASPQFGLPNAPPFEPVTERPTDDGGAIVRGWTLEPSGMVPETTYNLVEYRFSRAAAFSSITKGAFTVRHGEVVAPLGAAPPSTVQP